MALNDQFWQGLDPSKPERLSKVLAALHCFHIAPPTDLFHCEFTVHPDDYHRIYNGFPELHLLEEFIGKPIPFNFDASTGSIITMNGTGHHKRLIRVLAAKVDDGLESLGDHPGSVGELARTVIPWDDYQPTNGKMDDRDGQPTNVTSGPALGYGCLPSRYPSLVLDYAGHDRSGPSKQAQCITTHGARTAVSIQLSFAGKDWLDDKEKCARMAANSAVWVWTKVDGTVKPVVHDQRLSTPGGQIELWLSDFVPDDTTLPDAFVRPVHGEERAANITIPYPVILGSLVKSSYVAAWMASDADPLLANDVNKRLRAAHFDVSGKRFFSAAARGAPVYRKPAAGVTFDPAAAARRASAASIGRFSTRFLRAFRK